MARSHCLATFGDDAKSRPMTAPTITPNGLLLRIVANRPIPNGSIKAIAATIFRRGAVGEGIEDLVSVRFVFLDIVMFAMILAFFPDLALEVVNDFLRRKTER